VGDVSAIRRPAEWSWSPPAVFSPQQQPSDRQVFRSAGSVVLWWVWLVFAVASLAAVAIGGRSHSSLVVAVLLVAITGMIYACALRPRIVADANGISVLNPLREHTVPWAAVTKVDLVNAVRVHCAPAPGASRGKIIYSWAVQSSARPKLRSPSRARRTAQQAARPSAGYGSLPPQAQDALDRSTAEFVAKQLDERAARERERAARERASASPARTADDPPGPPPGTRPELAPGTQPGPAPGIPSVPGAPQVTWAWTQVAVMVIPVLALVIVVIT
jgi:hypothetical protein